MCIFTTSERVIAFLYLVYCVINRVDILMSINEVTVYCNLSHSPPSHAAAYALHYVPPSCCVSSFISGVLCFLILCIVAIHASCEFNSDTVQGSAVYLEISHSVHNMALPTIRGPCRTP